MSDNEPVRLQLCRAKGFDLQAASLGRNGLPVINVARPGVLGNPFVVGKDGDRAYCVDLFRTMLAGHIAVSTRASVDSQRKVIAYIAEHRAALRNHNVACWCKPDALCHGDVLLKLFNAPVCEAVA